MSRFSRRRFVLSSAVLAASAARRRSRAEESAATSARPGQTPHTRFAVNVEMWWTRLPLLERVREAAGLGFPAIEFWPWRGKDIDALAAESRRLGIDIAQFTAWGFRPGLNEPRNHPRFLQEIKESCAVAHKLECHKMTVVGGDDVPGKSPRQMHDSIIDGLRQAAPIAEDAGVMLILEPMNIRVDHQGHCLYGSPDALRICREVDSPMVKINWDLYHMQISEGDLCGRLREGFDQVGYLQVADHPGRHEPGTGEIRYNRVLREAYALGYRGYVGLECRPLKDEMSAARAVASADNW